MPQSKQILLLYILVGLLFFFAAGNLPLDGGDFRHNLWAPARNLLQGSSPYQVQPDGINSVWFPFGISFFLPVGFLPFELAYRLWTGLSIAALLAVFVFLSPPQPGLVSLGAALLACMVFPPVVTTLLTGQFSIIALFCLLFACQFYQAGRPVLAGLLLALAFTKPQLALWTIPVLVVLIFRQGGWRECVRAASWLAFWLVLLLLPLFLSGRTWLKDFWDALTGNPAWQQPSLYSLVVHRSGDVGVFLWALLTVISLAACLYLALRLKPNVAVLTALLLTAILSPYIWSWDFVLLLPLFTWQVLNTGDRLALGILWLGYVAAWLGVLLIKTRPGTTDQALWWLPLAFALMILLSLAVQFFRRRLAWRSL